MAETDPYWYARKHEAGPGAWCVRGPDDFEMSVPYLDKNVAYAIAKILSGRYREATRMLESLAEAEYETLRQKALQDE